MDVDVDLDSLQKFIQTLDMFQQQMADQMRVMSGAWTACKETLDGPSAREFVEQYDQTQSQVLTAIGTGEDALSQLRKLAHVVTDLHGGR
ncbi:MAG: transcription termination factor NusA [Candidatus Melainabacteria bacterium]|nr:transcription termination factor NusA [Candidatus Melainabacteria bacterium]